jgi:hypothetical protein
MGQRGAIVMFLAGGGLLVPVAMVLLLGHVLGPASVAIAIASLLVGVVCLVAAIRSRFELGQFWTFGPGSLTGRERYLYFCAYALIAAGALLALASTLGS